MTLALQDVGDRVVGGLEYATALFEPATVERYAGYLRMLLAGMVADDQQTVATLPWLPVAERRQVLTEWNATETAYPQDRCIHELFEEQAARRPEATAVVCETAAVSYGTLNARANQLAHYLRRLGVGPDVRVAMCVERGVEMVVGLLAVLKAGGAYIPLDPSYPVERLQYMLTDSAPAVLLTAGLTPELLGALPGTRPTLDLTAPMPGWAVEPTTNPDRTPSGLTPSHLAYIIYTSGSTGTPKGVMVAHRGVVNRLLWMPLAYGLSSRDRLLQKTAFSFDGSVWEIFDHAIGRRHACHYPVSRSEKDPARLFDVIMRDRRSPWWILCPRCWKWCWRMSRTVGVDRIGECVLWWRKRCRQHCRNVCGAFSVVPLHNLYGPTEATVDVTAWTYYRQRQAAIVPIGRPIAKHRFTF